MRLEPRGGGGRSADSVSSRLVSIAYRLYRSAASAAWWIAPALSAGGSKLARGMRARRGAADRLVDWAERERDSSRPLLWLHAPSVGEGLQARACLDAVRLRRPDLQLVFTYFSPSADELASSMPVDFAGTLPWDTTGEAGRAAAAVEPRVVAFTKSELWPVLASSARLGGARTALIAATLPHGSSRLRWPTSAVLKPTLAGLELVAAISAEDGARLVAAGASASSLRVTGDPGIDAAAGRVRAADQAAPHLRPFRGRARPTVVAGSTWPSDEEVLVPALTVARARHPGLLLVVAPHEPDERALGRLEIAIRRSGMTSARLSAVERDGTPGAADVVLVDRVGVLSDLYTVADLAWVGGGFHDAGLHSVLEPAAAGVPVLFGPRWRSSRAAGEMLGLGAARVVGSDLEAAQSMAEWLDEPAALASAGRSARGYIGTHLGAAVRTAELLSELIPRHKAR